MATSSYPKNSIARASSISKSFLTFLLFALSIANTVHAGPSHDALEGPVYYATWNSFLDQTNVLVLTNRGSVPMAVSLSLYDMNGIRLSYVELDVPANGEKDVIINEINGFVEDSYGTVRIDSDQPSALEGHSVSYRAGEDGDYEFAITRSLVDALTANNQVFFNSIQPSQNPDEANNAVITYLQISNIEDFVAGYTINKHNEVGELVSTSHVNIPAHGRRDLEVVSAPGQVGLLEIIPNDFSFEYLAQVASYGSDQPVGIAPTAFNFAFSEEVQDIFIRYDLEAGTQYLNVSRGAGAQTWLAIANANVYDLDVSRTINLKIIDNDGNKVLDRDLSLGTRSQLHVDVNSVLAEGQSGIAILTDLGGAVVIANSRVYYSDSSGSITAASLQEIRPLLSFSVFTAFQGNYNTFLGNLNWLRLFNAGESNSLVNVELLDPNGISLGNQDLVIGAGKGLDIELGTMLSFDVPENTYGLVKITTQLGGPISTFKIVPQLLRLKPSSSDPSVVDLASPLQLMLRAILQ